LRNSEDRTLVLIHRFVKCLSKSENPNGAEMSIIKRGENTYLVRVYLGRDALTKKRIETNVTVHGTLASAKKLEAKLKGQKESGHLIKTSHMVLNRLLDLYLDSARHVQSEGTQYKYRIFLNYYVRPYIGSIPIKKITTSTLQELFNFLLDKKKGHTDCDDKGNE